MASLNDPAVGELLRGPNSAIISTHNEDGSILSAVAWISLEDGQLAVNTAEGRQWPTNLDRDPQVTALVYNQSNPYEYVEIRGTASGTREDADDHIDRLSHVYIGQDYPYKSAGEVRRKYVISPHRVRYVKQG